MNKRDLSAMKKAHADFIDSLGQNYAPAFASAMPWLALNKLVEFHASNLGTELYDALKSASAGRNIPQYFDLQKFNDPTMYGSSAEYYAATSVLSFLKKFPFGKVATLDPEKVAIERFRAAETQCRITNKRLRFYRLYGFRLDNKRRGMHGILHSARSFIVNWLGPLDLNSIYDYMKHGPGGAGGVSGDETTAYFKFAVDQYTVTPSASKLALAAVLADPLWRRYIVGGDFFADGGDVPTVSDARKRVIDRLEFTNYNKVTFAPKTAKTHRAIAVEPLLNMYLQLGVGHWLTARMRQFGLNLRSQARNQHLALEGSAQWDVVADCLATIDLSMASDTLCLELVRELVPPEWFDLLFALRPRFGMLGDEKIHWAKFSSMGNGFTFQLESMIFYALALSVAKHCKLTSEKVAVYGDDIICPRSMALQLAETLNYCGFKLNTDKSFLFGPFRESCGKDYYGGVGVRPFFLKREIENRRDMLFLANSFGGLYDNHPVANLVVELLPKELARDLLGPRVEDLEGHIHCPLDLAQKSSYVLWDRDMQVWTYLSSKARAKEIKSWYAPPLYLQFIGGTGGLATRRSPESSAEYYGKPYRTRLGLLRKIALFAHSELDDGGSLAIVTARNRVEYTMSTQTIHGWRNDRVVVFN